jgi:hypothetical protein
MQRVWGRCRPYKSLSSVPSFTNVFVRQRGGACTPQIGEQRHPRDVQFRFHRYVYEGVWEPAPHHFGILLYWKRGKKWVTRGACVGCLAVPTYIIRNLFCFVLYISQFFVVNLYSSYAVSLLFRRSNERHKAGSQGSRWIS